MRGTLPLTFGACQHCPRVLHACCDPVLQANLCPAGRPSKEVSIGKHTARKAGQQPGASAEQQNGMAEALARLQAPDTSASDLATEVPGPQLGELDAVDRTDVELGAGPGEVDEEDDPWHIPASHEVLLQGRPLLAQHAAPEQPSADLRQS